VGGARGEDAGIDGGPGDCGGRHAADQPGEVRRRGWVLLGMGLGLGCGFWLPQMEIEVHSSNQNTHNHNHTHTPQRADVVAVVFDASDAASFAAAKALAVGVSTLGGEGLPVVLVAAKDDLGSSPVRAFGLGWGGGLGG